MQGWLCLPLQASCIVMLTAVLGQSQACVSTVFSLPALLLPSTAQHSTVGSHHHHPRIPPRVRVRVCAACVGRAQAFEGADIIVHELGNNVTVADLMERPAAVRDDRLVASRFGVN